MSKQSTERRSYSVDEMMEKLREGDRAKREREEGEVVTRPDGSQVVRVRRRKRRSKQVQKTREVRLRRLGILAAVASVVLLVSLAATVLILLARFNSKGYRDELKERVLASTGAQVGIDELSVTPLNVRAKAMEFQWPGSGVLKSLKLRGLSASLEPTSLLGADWNGELVNADSGTLRLGPPDGSAGQRILDGAFPFDYDNYRCGNLQIVYGEDVDAPAFHVKGSEVSVRPREEGGSQFLINGGRVALGHWNELRISNGLAELSEEQGFHIVALRLTPPGDFIGEATLRGTDPLRPNKSAHLEIELAKYSLAHFLGGTDRGLGRLLGGVVNTLPEQPGTVTVHPDRPGESGMEVEFAGEEGSLSNFMFLGVLSGLFRNSEYNQPASGVVSGTVKFDRAGIHLRDYEFEMAAFLKLEGNIELGHDGALTGALRIGVPLGAFMTKSLERYHTIFSPPEGPYRWITISLLGTIQDPLDDLGKIIEDEISPKTTQPESGNGWENAFRRLTDEPEEDPEP